MGEYLLKSLSMENYYPSTLLSTDPSGTAISAMSSSANNQALERESMILQRPLVATFGAPDINIPLSADCTEETWNVNPCDLLDAGLGSQLHEKEMVNISKNGNLRSRKRRDSIWGAWFFFSFYFRPIFSDKCRNSVVEDSNGVSRFEKSDLLHDVFLVQHDMENMYMWTFKERPENALGKMQLRSYMNGHSHLGEPQFPFSVTKGFTRSHCMQRKHYRGLSNPQCIHAIGIVRSPDFSTVSNIDLKRWMDLTGRDLNFSLPPEASDFSSWRNLPNTESLREKTQRKLQHGSALNWSSASNNSAEDSMDLSPKSCKRKKDASLDEECFVPLNHCHNKATQGVKMHPAEPSWQHNFTGMMRWASGPVTAAKSIYEDKDGFLIMVSLPCTDHGSVKVTWRNNAMHGIVKIQCLSTGCAPYLKRNGRIFKLTDHSAEHCPPGEFIREIPLLTRIPEDAEPEAYYDEAHALLEILVPKRPSGSEEHEVHVCIRPPQF